MKFNAPANKLGFALYMAKSGFSVIPVGRDKKPLIPWDQYKIQSPSIERIHAWNNTYEDPNWAVITGIKLDILDFEVWEDVVLFFPDLDEIKKNTLVVRSPHGGAHVYYMNRGEAVGRHTKIFTMGHAMDFLNGDGYALLPYSEVDHHQCDTKKPCDHKSTTRYEVISQTIEIQTYPGGIARDIFKRGVELGWISEIDAERKLNEWTNKKEPNSNAPKANKEIDQAALQENLNEVFAENPKFKYIFETGDFAKFNYPSSSEAEQFMITFLLGRKFDPEVVKKIMNSANTHKIQNLSGKSRENYLERSIMKAENYLRNEEEYREKQTKAMYTNNTNGNNIHAINPRNWFSEDKENPRFVPYNCAMDYMRVFSHVITEYMDVMHQFTGKYYLKNAEGAIRTTIENAGTGIIKPRDINDAISSLKNITRIIDPDKIDLPMERIMPLPAHTIPIEDGLLNLLTKTISPHSPDYYYTECLPRHYIPGAIPRYFLDFLDKIFLGDTDASIKKLQLMETIAWTLMAGYDIHGCVIFYGQGGEGKSIIHSVFGDLLAHVTSLTLSELESDKFKRAELYGSWANLISESSNEIVTSEWFKRLTDGTIITVDRKNGHPFQMVSRAKLILDVNELPNKDDELRAFYRRVIAIIDFPNLLESILTPTQIDDYIHKMKDPEELDRIFSYVVDNYYAPLVSRMKFTAQLSLADAEQKWEERSNPAKSYVKMKTEAGDILTDVDTVRDVLNGDENKIRRYITRENNGNEYLTMIKADVITAAKKWATTRGFPIKTIHGGTIGAALVSAGFPNQTVSKKVSKDSILKAWENIFIRLDDGEVTDHKNPPLSPETQSEINGVLPGNGPTVSSSAPARTCAHESEYKGVRYRTTKTLDNTKEKSVTPNFGDPLPKPLPPDFEKSNNPSNFGLQSEKQQSPDMKSEESLTQDHVSGRDDHESKYQNLVFRKVIFDSPVVNPDPEKYKIGTYLVLTKQEAQEFAAYNFSVEVSFAELKAKVGEVAEEYIREYIKKRNENKTSIAPQEPITEEEAAKLIDTLLGEGFQINPSKTGPSLDKTHFKITVVKPSNDAKLAILVAMMEDRGFHTEGQSISELLFTRPLKEVSS